MEFLKGQMVRAVKMSESSNYLQVEGAVTGVRNGFVEISAICVMDRYSKKWSMHPTSCACSAKESDVLGIDRLSLGGEVLANDVNPQVTAILHAFDVEAAEFGVPAEIQAFVRDFISSHQIKGLSDPMYVANTAAMHLGVGDGCSKFYTAVDDIPDDAAKKIAVHLCHAYSGTDVACVTEKIKTHLFSAPAHVCGL